MVPVVVLQLRCQIVGCVTLERNDDMADRLDDDNAGLSFAFYK